MSAVSELSSPFGHAPAPVPDPAQPLVVAAERVFIRTATTGDLPAMAVLQLRELPLGLFPSLGRGFLTRWHNTFLDSPHAVALAAVHRRADGQEPIVGFLIGSTDRDAFRQEMLRRHRGSLLAHGLAAIMLRPHVLPRFLHTRLRPYLRRLLAAGRRSADDLAVAPHSTGEVVGDLTAIAVDRGLRRSGAGRRMVEIYFARCAALGIGWVELTMAQSAGDARAFYCATGWTALASHRTRDGVPVERFGRAPGRPEGVR